MNFQRRRAAIVKLRRVTAARWCLTITTLSLKIARMACRAVTKRESDCRDFRSRSVCASVFREGVTTIAAIAVKARDASSKDQKPELASVDAGRRRFCFVVRRECKNEKPRTARLYLAESQYAIGILSAYRGGGGGEQRFRHLEIAKWLDVWRHSVERRWKDEKVSADVTQRCARRSCFVFRYLSLLEKKHR